jgi:hypothetical protein
MLKVKIIKNYKNFQEGKVYEVGRNEAHSLIDKNYAVLYNISNTNTSKKYANKMMRS